MRWEALDRAQGYKPGAVLLLTGAIVVALMAFAAGRLAVSPQSAAASSPGEVAAKVAALAGSPAANAAEREIFEELRDPSLARSSGNFLARYGDRLTAFQRGLLRLSLDLGSPRYSTLRSDLRHHRVGARRFGPLIELLTAIGGNVAVRELEWRGVWLKRHPGTLSAYLTGLSALSRRVPPSPLAAGATGILADRGVTAYIRELPPLTVASLLPVERLVALTPPLGRRHGVLLSSGSSGASPQSSLGTRAKRQLSGFLDRSETQLSLMLSAIQNAAREKERQLRSYLEAHKGEINGKGLLKLLFPEVPAGWILPYVMKWLEKEARRIQDTFPTPDGPPGDCAPAASPRPRSAASASAAAASCSGSLEIGPAALAAGIPGVRYSQPLQASGASGHLTWRVEGEMPAGLDLNFSTGVIEGRPRYLGVSEFTVVAQEDHGASGRKSYSLVVNPPSCSGSPCAVSYGDSEVTVVWGACGCTIPSGYHGLFGYYLEPVVNGIAGGSAGHSFVLGPLSVNAPDGSQGVPVFAGPGRRLWYTYPHFDGAAGFDQAFPDQMYLGVYFATHRDEDEELTLFPMGNSNAVTVK